MMQMLKTAIEHWVREGTEESFLAMVQSSYAVAGNPPRFQHDCDHCLFFGHVDGSDLYMCLSKHDWKRSKTTNLDSMLLRRGNSAPDYFSYLKPEAFADPQEFFARMKKRQHGYIVLLMRAKEVGLYTGEF